MDYALYQKISKVTLGKQPADLVLKNLKLVDVFTGEIVESNVAVKDGLIAGVSRRYRGKKEIDLGGKYLAPGFIDAHLHLESTMVTPNELVSTAARFGTTTFIVDPHEAANVSGAAGIDYILDQTEKSPANVYVMMPSCVPATHVDDNGGIFSANDMYPYVRNPRVLGLGEVMDDPGVINGDESMFSKLLLFENRTIDGHAPYLPNRELSAYKMAGVDTDHEATSFEYALEEVRRGIHVHIREGSAAHNLKDIVEGIVRTGIDTEYFSFCTDDKHIEDILRDGHISYNVKLAVSLGMNPVQAIKMATINTAKCYGLKHLGAISPGFQADFVVLDNLQDLNVTDVFYKGKLVDRNAPIRVKTCGRALKHTVHLDKVKASKRFLRLWRTVDKEIHVASRKRLRDRLRQKSVLHIQHNSSHLCFSPPFFPFAVSVFILSVIALFCPHRLDRVCNYFLFKGHCLTRFSQQRVQNCVAFFHPHDILSIRMCRMGRYAA